MNSFVNFDNAATTFPKPPEVKRAVAYAISNYGGNSGRGGHILSEKTTAMVFRTRQAAANFFDAEPENVVFCSSCTHALNTAIKGVISPGCHVVTSSLEHNSVIRPLVAMQRQGLISLTVAEVFDSDDKTTESFKKSINDKTRVVVCTAASNVTGQILPLKKISEICQGKNICFIVDGAQASGIIPLSLKTDGINILCTSGHKGLYGISGTGLLITDGKFHISPLMQGGTGSGSLDLTQPDFLPDSLESGTLNTAGIASLEAGIKFINGISLERIHNYEEHLTKIFISCLSKLNNVILYRPEHVRCVPLLSFNIKGKNSEETADYLNKKGFCLRAGFHCSPLAHRTLGTDTGAVRFAPSVYNTETEVKKLCQEIKNSI